MQKNYLGIKLTNLFRMKTFLIILLGGADMLLDIAAEQQYIFSRLPLHA